MKHTAFRTLPLLAGILAALLFAGCETTAPTVAHSETNATAGAFPRDAMKQLRLGMMKTQVVQLVGEPSEVIPAHQIDDQQETWRYYNTLDPLYHNVAVEMEEIAYVDPITGIERTILDPRQELERVDRRETFTLTFNMQERLADMDYDLVTSRSR